jgi:outer membrane protein OmpA-like peptidoglycan-associated protein
MNTRRLVLAASALAALLAAPAAFSQWGHPGWARPYPHLAYRYAYGPRFYPYPWFYGPPYYALPLYAPPPVYARRYYMPAQAPAAASGQRQYQESQVTHARIEPPRARMERTVLSARELFDFDKAKVHGAQPRLDEIAQIMEREPAIDKVRITGYTDRIGSDSYNQKLSEQRARAVKDYLVHKGVSPERLVAVGKGKANPLVACNDPKQADLIKCLEANRRVEVEEIVIERHVPQG